MSRTPDYLEQELFDAVDLCISTGARVRSDPGTHELSLAMLSNVMGRIALSREAFAPPSPNCDSSTSYCPCF
jgi:hypothetical protein